MEETNLEETSSDRKKSIACGDDASPMAKGPGLLSSPNYPENYPRNSDCFWLASVDSGDMCISFVAPIETEQNNDYLRIYNGDTKAASVAAQLSGSINRSPMVRIEGRKALLTFHSDGSVADTGFLIRIHECSDMSHSDEYSLIDGRCNKHVPCADGRCCSKWRWCGMGVDHNGVGFCAEGCLSGPCAKQGRRRRRHPTCVRNGHDGCEHRNATMATTCCSGRCVQEHGKRFGVCVPTV